VGPALWTFTSGCRSRMRIASRTSASISEPTLCHSIVVTRARAVGNVPNVDCRSVRQASAQIHRLADIEHAFRQSRNTYTPGAGGAFARRTRPRVGTARANPPSPCDARRRAIRFAASSTRSFIPPANEPAGDRRPRRIAICCNWIGWEKLAAATTSGRGSVVTSGCGGGI
jgi:hypothetical protein